MFDTKQIGFADFFIPIELLIIRANMIKQLVMLSKLQIVVLLNCVIED